MQKNRFFFGFFLEKTASGRESQSRNEGEVREMRTAHAWYRTDFPFSEFRIPAFPGAVNDSPARVPHRPAPRVRARISATRGKYHPKSQDPYLNPQNPILRLTTSNYLYLTRSPPEMSVQPIIVSLSLAIHDPHVLLRKPKILLDPPSAKPLLAEIPQTRVCRRRSRGLRRRTCPWT